MGGFKPRAATQGKSNELVRPCFHHCILAIKGFGRMNDEMEVPHNKRLKKDNPELYGVILYVIPLSDQWKMAITSKAERFYIDEKGGQSVWQMPRLNDDTDDDLRIAYKRLSDIKNLILCLLGMIRGVRVNNVLSERIRELLGIPAPIEVHHSDKNYQHEEIIDLKKGRQEQLHRKEDERYEQIDNNDDDDDDENEFALGLSDFEALVDEDDHESEPEIEVSKKCFSPDESSDPEILGYFQQYNNLTKIIETELARNNVEGVSVSAAIGFLKLLEELRIDAFSSYDLEIDDIIENPNYVIRGCHRLSSRMRRSLWDEYCRVQGTISPNAKSDSSGGGKLFEADTPEVQFALCLKTYQIAKLPKFYTDYNRQRLRKAKDDKNDAYPKLCKQLSLAVRQSLYNKWFESTKLSQEECENKVLKGLKKVQKPGMRLQELLDVIKEKKLIESFDCFFMDGVELGKLESKL